MIAQGVSGWTDFLNPPRRPWPRALALTGWLRFQRAGSVGFKHWTRCKRDLPAFKASAGRAMELEPGSTIDTISKAEMGFPNGQRPQEGKVREPLAGRSGSTRRTGVSYLANCPEDIQCDAFRTLWSQPSTGTALDVHMLCRPRQEIFGSGLYPFFLSVPANQEVLTLLRTGERRGRLPEANSGFANRPEHFSDTSPANGQLGCMAPVVFWFRPNLDHEIDFCRRTPGAHGRTQAQTFVWACLFEIWHDPARPGTDYRQPRGPAAFQPVD